MAAIRGWLSESVYVPPYNPPNYPDGFKRGLITKSESKLLQPALEYPDRAHTFEFRDKKLLHAARELHNRGLITLQPREKGASKCLYRIIRYAGTGHLAPVPPVKQVAPEDPIKEIVRRTMFQ